VNPTELYLHALEEVPRGGADVMDKILDALQKPGS